MIRLGTLDFTMPNLLENQVRWTGYPDKEALVWDNAHSRPRQLWADREHAVIWNPLVLNGSVVQLGRGEVGRGYAEKLTLNLPPWRLGIERLKWGRFCGTHHSLVWIEWEGRISRRVALLDGRDQTLLCADRAEILTSEARLLIESPKEIVSESLGEGALRVLGGLRMFAASRFLSGSETKWLANANLEHRGLPVDSGSVVYEEVKWQ